MNSVKGKKKLTELYHSLSQLRIWEMMRWQNMDRNRQEIWVRIDAECAEQADFSDGVQTHLVFAIELLI